MKHNVMKALILEDDTLLADLLETVVGGLYPGIDIFVTASVRGALAHWSQHGSDLMIIDWNLPDGSGLEVIRAAREKSSKTAIVMISGRADRDSVLKAARYGINGYISKPFSVEMVHERLTALVDPAEFDRESQPDLEHLLQTSVESVIQLPSAIDTARVLELMARKQDISPSQLAERWHGEVALTTRLLDVANSASFQKTGEPVRSLRDGIATMGVDMALRHAMAMSLDICGQLRDTRLAEKATVFLETAEKVAQEAVRIALRIGIDQSDVHTAALLSRVGELAVLKVMQQCLDRKGQVSDEQIESGLTAWAQSYGNRLKVQWHLPLQLRELIGAVHFLPRDATSDSKLVMRASALIADGQNQGEECLRLLRRLGVDNHERGTDDG